MDLTSFEDLNNLLSQEQGYKFSKKSSDQDYNIQQQSKKNNFRKTMVIQNRKQQLSNQKEKQLGSSFNSKMGKIFKEFPQLNKDIQQLEKHYKQMKKIDERKVSDLEDGIPSMEIFEQNAVELNSFLLNQRTSLRGFDGQDIQDSFVNLMLDNLEKREAIDLRASANPHESILEINHDKIQENQNEQENDVLAQNLQKIIQAHDNQQNLKFRRTTEAQNIKQSQFDSMRLDQTRETIFQKGQKMNYDEQEDEFEIKEQRERSKTLIDLELDEFDRTDNKKIKKQLEVIRQRQINLENQIIEEDEEQYDQSAKNEIEKPQSLENSYFDGDSDSYQRTQLCKKSLQSSSNDKLDLGSSGDVLQIVRKQSQSENEDEFNNDKLIDNSEQQNKQIYQNQSIIINKDAFINNQNEEQERQTQFQKENKYQTRTFIDQSGFSYFNTLKNQEQAFYKNRKQTLNKKNDEREIKKLELLNGDIEVERSYSSHEDNNESIQTTELNQKVDQIVKEQVSKEIILDLINLVVENLLEEELAQNIYRDTKQIDNQRLSSEIIAPQPQFFNENKNERFKSANQMQPILSLMNIKKKIFIKNRIDSIQMQSTRHSSNEVMQKSMSQTTQNFQSAVSGLLNDEESDDEFYFQLQPPDKYSQSEKHLFTTVLFSIGGKLPVFISCDLSKKHTTFEVIKHVLTLCRKNKEVQQKVKFNANFNEAEAFELRLVNDEDSDSSDFNPNKQYFKPDMDFPPLSNGQQISDYHQLVLIEKKNWAKLKQNNNKIPFTQKILEIENLNQTQQIAKNSDISGSRVFYVVLQCVPIPFLLRFTKSQSIIIPIQVNKNQPANQIYKQLNLYIQSSLQEQGQFELQNSSKLKMNEKNNKLFYCTNEQIFEDLYQDPYKLFKFINEKKIDFQKNLLNIQANNDYQNEVQRSKNHQNYVFEIDNQTLIQNIEKPYIFVTLKIYADQKDFTNLDVNVLHQHEQLLPLLNNSPQKQKVNKIDSNSIISALQSQSFKASNFAMEHLLHFNNNSNQLVKEGNIKKQNEEEEKKILEKNQLQRQTLNTNISEDPMKIKKSFENKELEFEQFNDVVVTSNQFSGQEYKFNSRSAQAYEEFNVLKTNRHSLKQKRILIVDQFQIYHRKWEIDPKTGVIKEAKNNFNKANSSFLNESLLYRGNQTITNSMALNDSLNSINEDEKSIKKIGFLRAKINNFLTQKVFTAKKRKRYIQNIIEIEHLIEHKKLNDNMLFVEQNEDKINVFSNKFYIIYKSKTCEDYYRNPDESQDDEFEDNVDRKVLYECENTEIAKYIVAKIKTSMILNQDKNNMFLKNLQD